MRAQQMHASPSQLFSLAKYQNTDAQPDASETRHACVPKVLNEKTVLGAPFHQLSLLYSCAKGRVLVMCPFWCQVDQTPLLAEPCSGARLAKPQSFLVPGGP